MIADTSDIHGFSAAQRRHADDLASVAGDLAAATVAVDAFGPVGAGFLAALNHALGREAEQVARLAERLASASSTAGAAAEAYRAAEGHAGQSISLLAG
jgi:HPt (histidine-containing phosphotransfer) domain-containing protein